MTSRRMRRLAALTMMGMALSACADGDGRAKGDAPEAGRTGSSGEPPASSQPGDPAPGEAPADFGLPEVAEVAAALGVEAPSTPGGTPGPPSGHAGATGGAPVPGGSSLGGTTTGGAAAPTQFGAADTGPVSGGGSSGGSGPKMSATPEDCAMLRQVMAIVDHPQLHQLKADIGC